MEPLVPTLLHKMSQLPAGTETLMRHCHWCFKARCGWFRNIVLAHTWEAAKQFSFLGSSLTCCKYLVAGKTSVTYFFLHELSSTDVAIILHLQIWKTNNKKTFMFIIDRGYFNSLIHSCCFFFFQKSSSRQNRGSQQLIVSRLTVPFLLLSPFIPHPHLPPVCPPPLPLLAPCPGILR